MAIVKGLIVLGNASVTSKISENGTLLENKYKQKLTAVTVASEANKYINSITQDSLGVISATKATLPVTAHANHALTISTSTPTSLAQGTVITYVDSITGCNATSGNITATVSRKIIIVPSVPSVSITTSGTGNVVTNISASGHTITQSLGSVTDEKVKLVNPGTATRAFVLLGDSQTGYLTSLTVLYANEDTGSIFGPNLCTEGADAHENVVLGVSNVVGTSVAYGTTFGTENKINDNIEGGFVVGKGNIVSSNNQVVIGSYNSQVNSAAFIIGNGTSTSVRSNALTVSTSGQITASSIKSSYSSLRSPVNYFATNGTIQSLENFTNQEKLTYSELVSKRNSGLLVPGKYYRIADYSCQINNANATTSNHNFYIILRALNDTTLSEDAFAASNDDSYWNNSKLNAWRLKYCLDNDTTRFEWADANNGKGVIYWMRDEFGNEAPYDFKNIRFTKYVVTFLYHDPYSILGSLSLFDIDSNIPGCTVDSYTSKVWYTFSNALNTAIDYSVAGNTSETIVYNNKILPVYHRGTLILNFITCIVSNSGLGIYNINLHGNYGVSLLGIRDNICNITLGLESRDIVIVESSDIELGDRSSCDLFINCSFLTCGRNLTNSCIEGLGSSQIGIDSSILNIDNYQKGWNVLPRSIGNSSSFTDKYLLVGTNPSGNLDAAPYFSGNF